MYDELGQYMKLNLTEQEMFKSFLRGTTICQKLVPMYLFDLAAKQAEMQKQLVRAY